MEHAKHEATRAVDQVARMRKITNEGPVTELDDEDRDDEKSSESEKEAVFSFWKFGELN